VPWRSRAQPLPYLVGTAPGVASGSPHGLLRLAVSIWRGVGTMTKARILIAGGGIGGLVAALALIQRGFAVQVYEQAPELREFGAGIGITPNGSRVLIELGLQHELEQVTSRPISWAMRLFNTGEIWQRPGSGAGLPAAVWIVHRADLHQTLATALEGRAPGSVRVGARCMSFEQDADEVTLLLDTGERVTGDALVGADGVHSRIRREMFGEGRATFTGYMAWRAVMPIERVPERLREQGFTAWVGPSGQIVTYPLRQGQLMNFAATVRRNDWLIESWSEAGTVEECRGDFADWHEDVLAIIDAIDTPYKWALIGRPPLEHCSAGRATLLGDAFHPTLPILGQGANMAIEDGMILVRCLEASSGIAEALHRYEAARLNRTSRIVQSSFERMVRTRTELSDPKLAHAFMDRLFKFASTHEWIDQYDAVTTPV
jgi:salicylate hydroxylase